MFLLGSCEDETKPVNVYFVLFYLNNISKEGIQINIRTLFWVQEQYSYKIVKFSFTRFF